MNGWNKRFLGPHGEGWRGFPPGTMLASLLAAALLAGGCAGDRVGAVPDGMHPSPDAAAAEPPPRVGVTTVGIDGILADNVQTRLSLAKEDCDAPGWRMERLVERADAEVREGLRALGYYEPLSVSIALNEGTECWQATVLVSPGEPVRIVAVDRRLEGPGSEDEAFAAYLDTLPPAVGDVLDHGAYEETKRSIERYAAEHGYLGGEFVARRFTVDVAERSAGVELVYRPGRRFRFGPLHIEGARLDRSLIERLSGYREGEHYDAEGMLELSQRLSQSGYFERVDVIPRVGQPEDDTIPVDVLLTPRKRHAMTAGAGITTDEGPRLRLGYEDRRATLDGHRWMLRGAASLLRRSLDGEYRIPLADPGSEWLSLDVRVLREHTETSRSDEARLGLAQTRSRWDDWLETRFVSLTYDDFTVGRTHGVARLITPGVRLATNRYDDGRWPTGGYRLHLELRGSHQAIGSDVSFLRASGSIGWVHALASGGRWLARTEVGVMAVDGFDSLPPSQRFFTGGDRTVRGYEFASLGPVDETGTVVGGRMLAVGSIEYEHPLMDRWSGAVFVDAGNAFDPGYRDTGVKTGVGLGVRWQSPIGVMQLDVARALDDTQRFRAHLRFGTDF